MKQAIKRLGTYLGEVGVEFRKISWPDRQELVDSSVVVIYFIVILAVVVLVCDKTIEIVLNMIHA